MVEASKITKLELRGTPQQAGGKHGETLRKSIRELYRERLEIIRELSAAPKDLIQVVAQQIMASCKIHSIEIWKEASATARAANLENWQLVVAGGFSDVLDVCGRKMGRPSSSNECTISAIRLEQETPVLAGTWDTHATAQESLVLIDRQIDGAHRSIALSTAGWPMQQGVTEKGIGFAIANLGATTSTSGTSYICALPDIVDQESIGLVLKRTKEIPLCSARYFVFLDAKGHGRGIETDGVNYVEVDSYRPHTNHFQSVEMKSSEGRPSLVEESHGRMKSMEQRLSADQKSVADVFEALSYETGAGYSIMKTGARWDDRTCAAFVISPSDRTIWYTNGPPENNRVFKASIQTN